MRLSIHEQKIQEIRSVYRELERFMPEEDKEKSREIFEYYITRYLNQAQARKARKLTNVSRALESIEKALLDYIDLLEQNTKTRMQQGNKHKEGTIVESGLLEDKLEEAVDSSIDSF